MHHFYDTVINQAGQPVKGATVTVKNADTSLATIYADNGGTPLANPVIADSIGFYEFYTNSTPVTLEIRSGGTLLRTISSVDIPGGGGGTGSVTAVSVATANGVSGTVSNPTTTPAITLALGAITPASVAAAGNVTGANLSGTNTGDQTAASITYTPSGTGAVARTSSSKFREYVSVTDFGAVADDTGSSGTDNLAAFNAAVAAIKAAALTTSSVSKGGATLFIPKGAYYLSGTLDIKGVSLIIEGEGNGSLGAGYATTLRFPASTTGIRIQKHNTLGTGVDSPATYGSDGTVIRGLALLGGGGSNTGAFYGVHLRARAHLENCFVKGFASHGLAVIAAAGSGGTTEGNANSWTATKCTFTSNGGSGVFVSGADVNAGNGISLDCSTNGRWGIEDNSFLGNTYTGCHAFANTLGPYTTNNNNAWNAFVGCYSESGQPASAFVYPTVVVGGIHAADVTGTGLWIKNFFGALANKGGFFSDDGTQSSRLNYGGYLQEWVGPATPSGHQWHRVGNDIRFTYSGSDANEMIRATGPSTTFSFGRSTAQPHFVWMPRAVIGSDNTACRYEDWGGGPPSTGYHARGERVKNTNAAVGSPKAWVCVTSGTPGVWVSEGNL